MICQKIAYILHTIFCFWDYSLTLGVFLIDPPRYIRVLLDWVILLRGEKDGISQHTVSSVWGMSLHWEIQLSHEHHSSWVTWWVRGITSSHHFFTPYHGQVPWGNSYHTPLGWRPSQRFHIFRRWSWYIHVHLYRICHLVCGTLHRICRS